MVLSMERWLGKVAVVTGANSGIGEAIAHKLVEEGVIVVGLDLNIERIQENSKKLDGKGKLFAVKTDVTREEDILTAFKWTKENVGPVSILVNCAGIFRVSSMLDGKTEDWKATLDTNLLGLGITCREGIKVMREHNIDGHVINICSITGHEPVAPNLNMYAPAKFGVKALTETIRLELNALKSKIKIGYISPGVVDTPMVRKSQGIPDSVELPNLLQPKDIAEAAIYILSTPPHVQIQALIITEMKVDEHLKRR